MSSPIWGTRACPQGDTLLAIRAYSHQSLGTAGRIHGRRIRKGSAGMNSGRPTWIRWANSDEELRECSAFRYDIYVREMNRSQRHADHSAGIVREPLDDAGGNFAAFARQGDFIGTARLNAGSDEAVKPGAAW